MIRANFFHKFFKYKQNNSHEIIKYHSNAKLELQNQINEKITEINQQISENTKALIEAQIVKFRLTFSKSNNFFEKVSRKVYKQKSEDSINWHQKKLKELYLIRSELIINLEKIKGIYWINRIKRFLIIIFIGFLVLLSLFIFISGFMIIIYLLPLIILFLIGCSLKNKKY